MSASFSENFTPIFRVWRRSIMLLLGVWLILCAERIPPGRACLWTSTIGLTVIYPTARFAATHGVSGRDVTSSGAAPTASKVNRYTRCDASVYVVAALCCLGALVVLWALGAPRAALLLSMCGVPGALLSVVLNRHGWAPSPEVTLSAFVGGVLFMASWWGLGVLALGLCAARHAAGERRAVIAAWVIGLGMAWVVYVPVLSVWSLLGFFWGFAGWVGR